VQDAEPPPLRSRLHSQLHSQLHPQLQSRLQSLASIEAALWRELEAAAADRGHEWRVAVLATVDAGLPEARCIVLREVDAVHRRVVFYSDARSPKVRQAAAAPAAVLVMWSRRLSWQLRLRVDLEVLAAGPEVASRWERLALTSAAQDYLAPLAPGSTAGDGEPPPPGRADGHHFAVLTGQVRSADWLELHPAGHRRAAFDDDGARWLVP
jgi:pyridoxamine 5'-phosphate oxidase